MGVEAVRHCCVGDVEGLFYGVAVDGGCRAVHDVENGEGAGDADGKSLWWNAQEAVAEAEGGAVGG